MSKKHSAAEGGHAETHHDELHVTRTTPQGTQEAGVPKGHELRDIKIREVLRWFVGLTVGTIVTSVLMWIFLEWMIGRENDEKTRVASPLYTGEATVRPGPELLPNPAQKYDKDPQKRYVLPWDHYGYFVKDESVKLKKVGLENGDGRPSLPADAVDEVLRETTTSVKPTKERYPQELMPSEGSGGTQEAIQILTK